MRQNNINVLITRIPTTAIDVIKAMSRDAINGAENANTPRTDSEVCPTNARHIGSPIVVVVQSTTRLTVEKLLKTNVVATTNEIAEVVIKPAASNRTRRVSSSERALRFKL